MSLAEHHRRKARTLHFQRVSWFSFMLAGLLIVQFFSNLQIVGAKSQVLAYATNVSQSDLFSITNQNRISAGLGALHLDARLNSAAQAKAEHMIANNYWSHVAPDGTTPWHFFDQAGYDYSNAGENLAYGFDTSAGVMNGWMNSPGHRANVLGSYTDVGFGIANGANYQGGENTVVVAMYGTPAQAPAPVVVPAQVAPQAPQRPSVTPPPAAPAAPQQALPPAPQVNNQTPTPAPVTTPTLKPVATQQAPEEPHAVTATQSDFSLSTSWPLYASMLIVSIAALGFSITHIKLLQLNWNRGARFALAHPMADAAAVGSISLLILSATVGFVG